MGMVWGQGRTSSRCAWLEEGSQYEAVGVCEWVISPENSSKVTGKRPWKPDRCLEFDVTRTGRQCERMGEILEEDSRGLLEKLVTQITIGDPFAEVLLCLS